MNKINHHNFVIVTIIICGFLISCDKQSDDFTYYDLSDSPAIVLNDTLQNFDSRTIMDMAISDSILFLIQYGYDELILAIDRSKNQIVSMFGHTGSGPDDMLDPSFISIINHQNEVYINDVNTKKLMKIIRSQNNHFHFEKLMDYHSQIFPTSNMCYSEDFIVGRKISSETKKMFYIYNMEQNSINDIDIYPKLKANINDVNYYYASNFGLHAAKRRIIAGMYFFDMFHVYNLNGERIKTVCFSKDCILPVDNTHHVLAIQNGYSGIVSIFSTNEYCYLLRYTEIPQTEGHYMLVQTDWDGKIIHTYTINEKLATPKFCVDSRDHKMYMVTHSIDGDTEYNTVVSYNVH
ncbi:MAG: hypothetical protein LBT48_07520 [Prevotellaceae bacterium]|jgi:hypothetical protein|nr:hypothetical protein [Prevotellaceae bacterium]